METLIHRLAIVAKTIAEMDLAQFYLDDRSDGCDNIEISRSVSKIKNNFWLGLCESITKKKLLR